MIFSPPFSFVVLFRFESHFLSEVMVKRSGLSEEKIDTDHRCLIHCHQTMPSKVGQKTVLEYCDIQAESSVGNNCIISNVAIPAGACIPDNAFMTTVCVEVGDVAGLYVTIVFGVNDNVKKTTRSDELGKLQYFGWPLDKALSLLDMKQVGGHNFLQYMMDFMFKGTTYCTYS